ncbi:hypothetical protein EES43_23745 [Streptomyces sp. ADI96-02]|nr:hypothetical protein EES43_23745 [Streptomyces sp. ADI96-02]
MEFRADQRGHPARGPRLVLHPPVRRWTLLQEPCQFLRQYGDNRHRFTALTPRNLTDNHAEIEQAASSGTTWCRASTRARTARCWFGCSATRTCTATASASTTSSCLSTRRSPWCTRTPRAGRWRTGRPVTRSMPRTPRAVRRPTRGATVRRRAGTPTVTSPGRPTPTTPRTTTGARRARWSPRSWTARNRLVDNIVGNLPAYQDDAARQVYRPSTGIGVTRVLKDEFLTPALLFRVPAIRCEQLVERTEHDCPS